MQGVDLCQSRGPGPARQMLSQECRADAGQQCLLHIRREVHRADTARRLHQCGPAGFGYFRHRSTHGQSDIVLQPVQCRCELQGLDIRQAGHPGPECSVLSQEPGTGAGREYMLRFGREAAGTAGAGAAGRGQQSGSAGQRLRQLRAGQPRRLPECLQRATELPSLDLCPSRRPGAAGGLLSQESDARSGDEARVAGAAAAEEAEGEGSGWCHAQQTRAWGSRARPSVRRTRQYFLSL